MNSTLFKASPLLLLGFLGSALALASDYHSPRSAGLGGAGHAGPLLNDALYLNPSFVSLLPSYSMAVNYQWYSGPDNSDGSPDFHGKIMNASIQDGRSELFQAGVGYTQTDTGKMIHVGASRSILHRIGIGLGGKFILPDDGSHTQLNEGIFSASGIVTDWFQVVSVIDNVFEGPESRNRGFYREYVLGMKVNISKIFLAYVDPHVAPHAPDGNTLGYESGIEFPMMSDLFLRAGMFRYSKVPFANVRGNGYGFGMGWIAPKISFDYGLEHIIDPVGAISQTLGMTVFF